MYPKDDNTFTTLLDLWAVCVRLHEREGSAMWFNRDPHSTRARGASVQHVGSCMCRQRTPVKWWVGRSPSTHTFHSAHQLAFCCYVNSAQELGPLTRSVNSHTLTHTRCSKSKSVHQGGGAVSGVVAPPPYAARCGRLCRARTNTRPAVLHGQESSRFPSRLVF